MKRAITLGLGALALATMSLPSSAADLGARPVGKAPVIAPVALYNWSGFYIGGHIGGVWGDKDWIDVTFPGLAFADGSQRDQRLPGGRSGGLQLAGRQLGVRHRRPGVVDEC